MFTIIHLEEINNFIIYLKVTFAGIQILADFMIHSFSGY